MLAVVLLGGRRAGVVFDGAFVDDGFARFMKVLALVGSLVTMLMSRDFLRARGSTSSNSRSWWCWRRSAC